MSDGASSQPELSPAEWRAVSIAINDAARYGCVERREPGFFGRLYIALTGNTPPRPLADSRLEAIRSFVCEVRRYHRADPSRLEAQGFNARQVQALTLLLA